MIFYEQIAPSVHLILEPRERKQLKFETIFTAGGSLFESKGDRGKTHLLEHCVASRTQTFDFQQFRDFQLKNYIFTNAHTSAHQMGLEASGHYSDFKTIFDILMEMSYNPCFDESILTQERQIVLREIDERSGNPAYRLSVWQNQQLYTPESRLNHQTLGSIEDVSKTSFEDLQRLHNEQILRSQTVILGFGGGFDTQEVKQNILELIHNNKSGLNRLSKVDTKNKIPLDYSHKSYYNQFEHLNLVHELAHQHVDACISIETEVNYQTKAVQRLFTELFLDFNGELYDLLRNKHGLVYSLSANFYENLENGVFEIELTTEIKKVEEVFKRVKEFFSDFGKVFDNSKFEALQRIISKKDDIVKDSVGSQANFLANQLIKYNQPITFDMYAQELKEVNTEDIQTLFEKIFQSMKKAKSFVVSKSSEIESIKGFRKI